MEIKLTPAAVRDREELSEKQWKEVREKLEEISNSLTHKDLKLIENPLLNHSIWQLTVDGEGTEHRIYLDVRDGDTVVLAIWNFEFTHQGDNHWKELEDRL